MTLWTDDLTILAEHRLLRRIPPQWEVRDDNEGATRPSSQAFNNDGEGDPMSTFLEQELKPKSLGYEHVIFGHAGFGLAALMAGFCRDEEQQRLARDPIADDPFHPCNPIHAVVVGKKGSKRRGRFAKHAEWVFRPGQLEPAQN